MKKFLILLKKEIRELITLQMLMPLILVVVIFYFVGNVISKESEKSQVNLGFAITDMDHSSQSQETLSVFGQNFSGALVIMADNVSQALVEVKNKNVSGLLVIPSGFGAGLSQGKQQKIEVYNVLNNLSFSQTQKTQITAQVIILLNNYFSDKAIQNANVGDTVFLKNPILPDEYVKVGDKTANISFAQLSGYIAGQTFFVPIILFLVIVLASQLVATTIANEKENKTLETLLSMPVSRKSIIVAKLVASGIVALFSAAIYLVGMRSYINGVAGNALQGISNNAVQQAAILLGLNFGISQYALLGISLFFGIIAALSVAVVLGAFAEDAKSVQGVTTPLMILIFIPYLLTLFINLDAASPILKYAVYAIPFTHSFLASSNILFHHYTLYIIGNIYLFVFFAVFVMLASKIFSTDKILTMKLRFSRKK